MIKFAYILQKIRFIYRIKASGLFSFEKFSSMLNFTHNINNLDHQINNSEILKSKILTPLNKLWSKLGIFLGIVVAPIVMALVFFLVVTPIGIFMRLMGKDLLNLRFNGSKSYWIEKTGPNSKMKNQF